MLPTTNAISKRSFSALWRVKTYLWSTMKQTRLNHLIILHVHKEKTDSLNLNDINNEFVRCSEYKRHKIQNKIDAHMSVSFP